MLKRLIVFMFSIVAIFAQHLCANNLQISNVSLENKNTVDQTVDVQFTISWDNSWRTPVNWDAAWVFIKFTRNQSHGFWNHATLSSNVNDHYAPSGSSITVGQTNSVGKGIFIYRSGNGSGTVINTNVKLQWNYGVDGVASEDDPIINVYGIEMVYIPQGQHLLGWGFRQDTSNDRVLVNTEGKILRVVESTVFQLDDDSQMVHQGIYFDGNDGINTNSTSATINNPDYPTGYKAFYCMKYEVSQGQFADFLTLTGGYTQPTGNRYTITETSTGTYVAGRPDRACNYLSWADGTKYADWAALRPMTELEFEKACRGPLSDDSYVWGSQNAIIATTLSGVEDGTETVITPNANCNQTSNLSGGDGGRGPLRCGIFAGQSLNRERAGATYYGILEMGGNVWERCVTIGNSVGRDYEGSHGDGDIYSPKPEDWPGDDALGSGLRGGAYSGYLSYMRTSDRRLAAFRSSGRSSDYGFRCVRSAP